MCDELRETSTETLGEGRVGDGADADGFERAEEEVGNELGHGGGGEVDGSFVLPSGPFADGFGDVDLEEFDTSEFEPALDEVSGEGGAHTSGEGHGTWRLYGKVAVVRCWVTVGYLSYLVW